MPGSPLRRVLKTGLALTVSMALCPAFASAATPFVLDNTSSARTPTVAVDANGVGHFVWSVGDIVRYCQVPRNGTTCKKMHDFTPPMKGANPPRVIVHPDGRVLIYTLRCCGVEHPPGPVHGKDACQGGTDRPPSKYVDPNLDYGYLYESSDGGSTWNPDVDYYPDDQACYLPNFPRVVGSIEAASDVVAGPGDFAISMVSSRTGEANFQAAPIAGYDDPPPGFKPPKFLVTSSAIFYPSVALVDPLTPIVALTDFENVYFREFGGRGGYYGEANWNPLVNLGAGTEPELAGGKKGTYLAYKTRTVPAQFVVRRFGGMSFGASTDLTPKGDPIFGDFFQDAGGNLNFTWQENGPDELRYRVSKDGTTWSPIKTLAGNNAGEFFNTEIAAAKDAGGFVAWDQNSKGPIRAVQFGPTGPVSDDGGGDEDCVPQVKVGAATVLAREGCLKRDGSKYTTKGDVRVNGIDLFTTIGGGGARVSAAAKITIDTADRTITTDSAVEAKVGNVRLDKAKIAWRIPQGGGQILDLAGNPAVFDTGQLHVDVVGLPVSGQTSPKVNSNGSVEIPVNLHLPEPFGGLGGLGDITGRATLRADLNGLHLANLMVRAKDVGLGIATIDELAIEYKDDPFILLGSADLSLPVTGAGIETDFGFRQGAFDFARATLVFPGDGIPVATLVYLRSIGFEVSTDPTKLAGSLKLGGGPKVFGTDLIAVTGTVSYTFPDSPNPGIFRAEGQGFIVDIQVANIFAQYETSGKFSFGGHIELGDDNLGILVDAEGFLDLDKSLFEMFNSAQVCVVGCFGGQGLINNNVIAGCIGGSLVGLGVLYEWDDGLEQLFSCDLTEYRLLSAARIAQAGTQTFTVQKGLPSAGVRLTGTGAPPRITVTGPQGQTLATGANPSQIVNTSVGVLAPDVHNNRTLVLLRKPAGGTWTIAMQTGSAPITAIARANGLRKPKIKASVSGKGRHRTLSYKVKPVQNGQRVRFSEVGKGAYSVLGTTTAKKGTIRFSPADGRRGKRRILAVIEQNGRPRDRVLAATYTAPGRIRPAKPRNVRLKRKGKKLIVTWGRAARATRYAVRVKLKDGRRLVIPTSRRRLVIRNVPGIDSGTIAVMGLRPDNTAGPAVTAKLKAKPKKRKRRRR